MSEVDDAPPPRQRLLAALIIIGVLALVNGRDLAAGHHQQRAVAKMPARSARLRASTLPAST